jgi:hypothetical protein
VARITTVAAGITRSHAITNQPRGITSNRAITNRRRVTINRPRVIMKAVAGTAMIADAGMATVVAVGTTITAVVVITIDTADAETIMGVAIAGKSTQMKAALLAPLFYARRKVVPLALS